MRSLNLIVRRVLMTEAAPAGRQSNKNVALAIFMYDLVPALYEKGGSVERAGKAAQIQIKPEVAAFYSQLVSKLGGNPRDPNSRDRIIALFKSKATKSLLSPGRLKIRREDEESDDFSVPKMAWPFSAMNPLSVKNYNALIFPGNVLNFFLTGKKAATGDFKIKRLKSSSLAPINEQTIAIAAALNDLTKFFGSGSKTSLLIADALTSLAGFVLLVDAESKQQFSGDEDDDVTPPSEAAGELEDILPLRIRESRSLYAMLFESSADLDDLDEPVSSSRSTQPIDLDVSQNISVDMDDDDSEVGELEGEDRPANDENSPDSEEIFDLVTVLLDALTALLSAADNYRNEIGFSDGEKFNSALGDLEAAIQDAVAAINMGGG